MLVYVLVYSCVYLLAYCRTWEFFYLLAYLCVYVFISLLVCLFVCISVYWLVCLCMHSFACLYMYSYSFACLCVCPFACLLVYVFACRNVSVCSLVWTGDSGACAWWTGPGKYQHAAKLQKHHVKGHLTSFSPWLRNRPLHSNPTGTWFQTEGAIVLSLWHTLIGVWRLVDKPLGRRALFAQH